MQPTQQVATPERSLLCAIVQQAVEDYKVLIASHFIERGEPNTPLIERTRQIGATTETLHHYSHGHEVKALMTFLFNGTALSKVLRAAHVAIDVDAMREALRAMTPENVECVELI